MSFLMDFTAERLSSFLAQMTNKNELAAQIRHQAKSVGYFKISSSLSERGTFEACTVEEFDQLIKSYVETRSSEGEESHTNQLKKILVEQTSRLSAMVFGDFNTIAMTCIDGKLNRSIVDDLVTNKLQLMGTIFSDLMEKNKEIWEAPPLEEHRTLNEQVITIAGKDQTMLKNESTLMDTGNPLVRMVSQPQTVATNVVTIMPNQSGVQQMTPNMTIQQQGVQQTTACNVANQGNIQYVLPGNTASQGAVQYQYGPVNKHKIFDSVPIFGDQQAQGAEEWLFKVDTLAAANLIPEDQILSLVLHRLKESAFELAKKLHKENKKWGDFKSQYLESSLPVDCDFETHKKLAQIKMTNFDNFNSFLYKFRSLVNKAKDINEELQIFYFLMALTPPITNKIRAEKADKS